MNTVKCVVKKCDLYSQLCSLCQTWEKLETIQTATCATVDTGKAESQK